MNLATFPPCIYQDKAAFRDATRCRFLSCLVSCECQFSVFEYICFCLNIADRVYFRSLFTGCLELSSTLIILDSVSVAEPDLQMGGVLIQTVR